MADEAAFSAEFDPVSKAWTPLNQAWAVFGQDAELETVAALDFPKKKLMRHRYLTRRWVPVLGRKDHARDP
eukprot:1214406-Pyramimonas_sp.AAC.1